MFLVSTPAEWAHTFDRLVSIEMLEAVGRDYIEPYFEMIDNVLNHEGVAVFQVITIPEGRFESCRYHTIGRRCRVSRC
jgi:cyclopropane-fatty-acyl-phospholipid synthase